MPISFSNIPATWRVPLYWVEVDPSKAGFPVNRQAALLVGTKLTTGASAAIDIPIPIASQAQADAAFGKGSELARMFKAFFANSWSQETWGLPVTDVGTAATHTITVTGAIVDAGTYHLYVGGTKVPVQLSTTDNTPTLVATKIAAAINANTDLPATAVAAAGVVTLTSKWKGVTGGDLKLQDCYYGPTGGEVNPPGLMFAYAQNVVAGTGVPDFANALANLGETPVEFVALPYTDSNTLMQWETEFGFSDAGRWGFIRQLYGHLFSAKKDTYAGLLTFGSTRNGAQTSIMGVETGSPAPVYEWAAAYTAKAGRGLSNDPARPLQTLHLESILPAKGEDRFLIIELNTLALSGIATQRTLSDNVPMISRESTTYQKNLYGNLDDAYELVTTMATLARLIRNQRHAITSKFPRHKLANDGTRFGAGQAIVTPKIIKAELIAQYRIDEFNGLVEDAVNFKKNLIVERDPNDPNRVNVLYPPDLINQLRVFAVLAQFRLQYDRGVDLSIIAA
jgi:phage tail sheath gpL-like